MSSDTSSPLVLLVVSSDIKHRHAAILAADGFRVATQTEPESTVRAIMKMEPSIIVAELDSASDVTLVLVRTLHQHALARYIPMIVYGFGLTPEQIESTARSGAMWLQLEPSDGYKLLGAVRGVLAAKAVPPSVTVQ